MAVNMLHCGSIDDVYAYEKIQRRPTKKVSPPLSPIVEKPRHKKAMSFSTSAPDSPPSAKLGAKKSMSFRWITRHISGTPGNSGRRVSTEDMKASNPTPTAPALPPKKPKEATKRIGFMDILLGYHSLLQATPAFPPTAAQRREIHPTIGFIRNPDYGTQG